MSGTLVTLQPEQPLAQLGAPPPLSSPSNSSGLSSGAVAGLSSGAVAGIVVGSIAGAALLLGGAALLLLKKRR